MAIDLILKMIYKELKILQKTFVRELNVGYVTLNSRDKKKANPSRLAMEKLTYFSYKKGIAKNIIESLEKI